MLFEIFEGSVPSERNKQLSGIQDKGGKNYEHMLKKDLTPFKIRLIL